MISRPYHMQWQLNLHRSCLGWHERHEFLPFEVHFLLGSHSVILLTILEIKIHSLSFLWLCFFSPLHVCVPTCSLTTVLSNSLWPCGLKPTRLLSHGILKARTSRGFSQPKDWTCFSWVSCIKAVSLLLSHWGSLQFIHRLVEIEKDGKIILMAIISSKAVSCMKTLKIKKWNSKMMISSSDFKSKVKLSK